MHTASILLAATALFAAVPIAAMAAMPPNAGPPGTNAGVAFPDGPPMTSRKPTPPVEAGMKITPMNRATFFIRDQEKSLKLYRDILGMRVFFHNYWDNGGINEVMNTKGESLNAIVLEGSSEVGFGKLGLYQLGPESVAKAPKPSTSLTTDVGDSAIVFTTNEIDSLYAKIKAAGYVILSAPAALAQNPRYEIQGKEMQFRDPDGIIVNLVQPGVLKKP
jgi:catechol 2,3-dioxygenase-like lactoylglutathione lyase family enzyme